MSAVYWLLDEQDDVLYVGMTCDLRRRMEQHRRTQSWWPEVASVAHTDEFPDFYDACETEVSHILALQPRYNRHANLAHHRPVPWRTEQERLELEASYLTNIFGARSAPWPVKT